MRYMILFFAGICTILISVITEDRKWPPLLIICGICAMYFAIDGFIKANPFKSETNGNEHLKNEKLEKESKLVAYMRTEADIISDAFSRMSIDFELQKVRLANAEIALQKRFEIRNMQTLMDDVGIFAETAFGKRPYTAALYTLKNETDEAIQDGSPMEFADMWLCLLDATRVRGYDIGFIYDTAIQKLQINFQRKWGAPDDNGVFHHIEE